MKQLIFDKVDKMPKISQWFISLEGEGENIGEPSLYLRLAGCYSAACKFCDTKFSWYESSKNKFIYDEDFLYDINKEIKNRQIQRATITGGEPLHFVEHFSDILCWLKNELKSELKHIGFETNGNLLQNTNIVLDLLEQINYIKNVLNINPTITISPKLEADSCYENQLSQDEVVEMYNKVFNNTIKYLDDSMINYKFIWGVNQEMNNLVKYYIKYLIDHNIKPKHIFLMPFTPENPMMENKDLWEESKKETAKIALELGVRFSPRLHIDVGLE